MFVVYCGALYCAFLIDFDRFNNGYVMLEIIR